VGDRQDIWPAKTSVTYLQRFQNRWRKKTKAEPANPGPAGKRLLKSRYWWWPFMMLSLAALITKPQLYGCSADVHDSQNNYKIL